MLLNSRIFELCLFDRNNFYSRNILDDFNMSVEYWSGAMCSYFVYIYRKDQNERKAFGYILKSCFYGFIRIDNETVFHIERKPTHIISNTHDMIGFFEGDLKMQSNTSKYKIFEKTNDRWEKVSMGLSENYVYIPQNRYCSVSIYMMKAYVDDFDNKHEAVGSAIGAVLYTNEHFGAEIINGFMHIISYYVAKIQSISEEDVKQFYSVIRPEEHLKKFNDHVKKVGDTSCSSVLFTTFDYDDGTHGMAYLGTKEGIEN
ncbi:hypothetical protein MXB_4079 [Myxobolus squamalis]|nr:hypothetical protein MXB_4079 [Myxobolus squamalis]